MNLRIRDETLLEQVITSKMYKPDSQDPLMVKYMKGNRSINWNQYKSKCKPQLMKCLKINKLSEYIHFVKIPPPWPPKLPHSGMGELKCEKIQVRDNIRPWCRREDTACNTAELFYILKLLTKILWKEKKWIMSPV